MRMAQEDEIEKLCSNSGGGDGGDGGRGGCGCSGGGNTVKLSKKRKLKKVPQRGLGVAQLERIRLEEQQKWKPSYQSNPSSSSVPFPVTISPPNSVATPTPSVQLASPPGWPPSDVPWNHNVQKIWNSHENNSREETARLDLVTIWPQPNLVQRAPIFHGSSSPKVNVPSMSSPSLLNIQMEPPSNQNYYGNCLTSWQDEEKIVGVKRQYPFYLDSQADPSLAYNGRPVLLRPIHRSDEAASSGSGNNNLVFDSSSQIYREATSCSRTLLQLNPEKNLREIEAPNGDFLTLAPTGSLEDTVIPQRPRSLYEQQQPPYYSFFPPATARTDEVISANSREGKSNISVDLNLKL